MTKAILPIHPKWVEKIFAGEKTVEIRTRWNIEIKRVYIYETAPVSGIVGHFDVKFATKETQSVCWHQAKNYGGFEDNQLEEFVKYLKSDGWIIGITNPVRYNTPIFHPPVQSYRYTHEEFESQSEMRAAMDGAINKHSYHKNDFA